MLEGYPLRKIKIREQFLMWGLSPLVLQIVVVFVLTFYALTINPPEFLSEEAMMQIAAVQSQRGFIIGTTISLPILIWIITSRKIPLVNRKQLTRKQWVLLPGLEKKDWKFLGWYIPVSYVLYTLGGVVIDIIFGPGEAVNQEAIEALVGAVPMWAMFLVLVIVAPLTEEWLFRGMVMFRHPTNNITWASTLFSALIFGLVHTPTNISSFYSYVGMGLLFAYAAKHTKSVEAAVVYHLLNNLLAFSLMLI